jgi:pyruvate/2-oxoglutarate dehydrogenase complex dihydrolipoamide acyltransferase (E2) component
VYAQVRNGAAVETKQMEVTLTADHRHIYGADSAQVRATD